jgi:hypothetical protein
MKKLNREFVLAANAVRSNKGRLVVMIITIVLFVLSAGAPNATIGIGK